MRAATLVAAWAFLGRELNTRFGGGGRRRPGEVRCARALRADAVEALEHRRLFAVTAGVSGNVLNVDGTSSAEEILVTYVSQNTEYRVFEKINGTFTQVTGSPFTGTIFSVDVDAGDGNDTVNTSHLPVYIDINGEGGNDTLTGTGNNDWIDGDIGNDSINGGGGDDYLVGWSGDDTIDGGDGADQVLGHDGTDVVYGGDGNDTVDGSLGADTLWGDDTTGTVSGADSLIGGTGDDDMYGGLGNDTMHGGDGHDVMMGDFTPSDTSGGADVMYGGEGDDWMYGGGGDDTMYGDDDSTVVADVLDGGDGWDSAWLNGTDTAPNTEVIN